MLIKRFYFFYQYLQMVMPAMSGLEATQELRRLGYTLPIIALTANTASLDEDECLAAGMNSFLSKPVLRERLAECLKECCSLNTPKTTTTETNTE